MNILYYDKKIIRTTRGGCNFWKYKYTEDFGRESALAYSWGNRENSGTGYIWAKPGEDFIDAINRRKRQYAE